MTTTTAEPLLFSEILYVEQIQMIAKAKYKNGKKNNS